MSRGAVAQPSPLIAYPQQAAFGRVLPKSKIYQHSNANTRLRDLFVKQVEQIIWQYKLAPETIKLPARPGVSEIQVFSIQLKTRELHHDVLRCIDRAIAFPILFELVFEGKTKVAAAYKRPNEADTSRWVISDYLMTDWLPTNAQRVNMPVALHMGGLYEKLLHRMIPLLARPGESLADLVARAELAHSKRRELDKVSARLAKERQFNRKVEINAELRKLKVDLERLQH